MHSNSGGMVATRARFARRTPCKGNGSVVLACVVNNDAATGPPIDAPGNSHATRTADLTSREHQRAAEAAALMVKSEITSFLMASAGGLRQTTVDCRCVRFRVLACCRVGKRGAFAKTLMTLGRPPAKNSARRFSRLPSRPHGCPSLSSEGIGLSGPTGQPNGSPKDRWG